MNALTVVGAIMTTLAIIGVFAVVHWIWLSMVRNGDFDFAVLTGLLLLMADGAVLTAIGSSL